MSTTKWYNPTSGKGKTILVTGGNGFVAAQILDAFLSRGYNVRTTVRSPDKGEALRKSFSKYDNQLSYAVVRDIVEEGAFDEAVKGVDGVVHSASPFVFDVKDHEHDLLIPAIKGTTNILKAVQKNAPQVERIIITSSFAAILDLDKGLRTGYTYTEKDWNPTTYDVAANPETSVVVSYCASKAFAEKAAWDFIKENEPNFNLSVICPPMVYGPNAQNITSLDHLNTSSADIYRLINGSEKTVPNTNFFGFVDVRDVGEIHARAYESAEAAGQRFLLAGGTYTYAQICEVIRNHFPQLKDKTPDPSTAPLENGFNVSNEKAKKELGMDFRDLETTIHDQVVEFLNLEKKLGKA
ncbi:7e1c9afb-6ef9-4444-a9f3-5e96e23de605 [Sclerotinia trifoliorum]|uniref:7e1c9afb-6ef9-4444-a9f3-5e96e23de605 n=1 Tax=Sclerotinia trifoliorum TaxID=28548 RepID=A0A8H2ZS15_9HELO|nr:7e1c9afb-6ef9-4444-a9f3-5e96e23de605 [Sclerotinia trifoliorum]